MAQGEQELELNVCRDIQLRKRGNIFVPVCGSITSSPSNQTSCQKETQDAYSFTGLQSRIALATSQTFSQMKQVNSGY